ncbi:MAG: dipeptidyl peptidase 3 [Bacteroidales bacterium]|nr:dipeptidyl peptidase 3 [Bacteroidales bacterium]
MMMSPVVSSQAGLDSFPYMDERFADLQMLRYRVDGFEQLSLRQKKLVYYLSEAALCGRDILWDQNGRYNLRIRRLLETVYTDYCGDRNSADFKAFVVYMKRIWFSNGIHHHYGGEKFQPAFSEDFLREAVHSVPLSKWSFPGKHGRDGNALRASVDALCDELFPIIFDPSVLPKRINLADGEDLLQTSAANYYGPDVTQREAEGFYLRMKEAWPDSAHPLMFGLNSRLVKENGLLKEKVWRSGGLYGSAIDRIVFWLEKAVTVAENKKQAAVMEQLIEYYRTGDLRIFDAYCISWVGETEALVDFTNGFTETYGDPLGMKASWEGFANFKDLDATARTETLSAHAQWFEDHSPVDARFKKERCKGISAKVIVAAILGGDLYPSSAIGINLPNSDWVRAEYGSKSVTIGNLTNAYNQASRGNGFLEEFVIDDATREMIHLYGNLCDQLHTDLHECLGHGSGKLLAGVDSDSLKAYGSTIEEARADLFGLYYIADPKLMELGLIPHSQAFHAQYYSYLMNGLMTQLVRIEPHRQIEEAHMRNRALVSRWVLEHAQRQGSLPAVEMVRRCGKSYVQVNDYAALRTLFGKLLSEIQRVKSEGDFATARRLVETYGVKVENRLHEEVLERYHALDLAPYKGFINPVYLVTHDDKGEITDISLRYDEPYDRQMLRYSRDYCTLPCVND